MNLTDMATKFQAIRALGEPDAHLPLSGVGSVIGRFPVREPDSTEPSLTGSKSEKPWIARPKRVAFRAASESGVSGPQG